MPKFPIIDSQRQLTTERPGVIHQNAAAPYEIASQAIEKVSGMVQKWQEAQDVIQSTAAKSNYETGMADILSRADQEVDFNASPKYLKEIDDVRKKSVEGVSNKALQQRIGFEFDSDASINKLKVENLFRKKAIDYTRGVTLPNSIDALLKKKIFASSSEEFARADMDLKILVEQNIKQGIISQAEGKKLLDDAEVMAATLEIYNDPIQGKADIEAGNYKIDAKTKAELINKAEQIVERRSKELEQAQQLARNNREDELVTMRINNSASPAELVKMTMDDMNAKRIDPRFAQEYIKALTSPKAVEAKTNSATFNKIAGDMIDISKKPDDIKLALLQKNATGELSDEDFQTLYTFLQNRNEKNIDKFLPKKTWLQRLFNNGKDKGLRQEIIADMFKQYLQRVNAGEDPGKAVSEITSMALDTHLAEQTKYPNRQYAINPETKQRIYSDDGVTWYDKTGKVIK